MRRYTIFLLLLATAEAIAAVSEEARSISTAYMFGWFFGLFGVTFFADCYAHGHSPFVMFKFYSLKRLFLRTFLITFASLIAIAALGEIIEPIFRPLLVSMTDLVTYRYITMILSLVAIAPITLLIFTLERGVARWFNNLGRPEGGVVRGSEFAPPKVRKAIGKAIDQAPKGTMFFANMPISKEAEFKHFKIVGVTGTGKSTVIREMIDIARERGDRLVIADPDGGYLSTFYDHRRDTILNPFDSRSAGWSLFSEIKEPYDFAMLAETLIPVKNANDEWGRYARTFLAALIQNCRRDGLTMDDLWNFAMLAPQPVLAQFLSDTPAAPYLDESNARMFGSIRSVCGTHLASLDYVRKINAHGFGVRDWVRSGEGTLFLPYQASQISSLRTLISAWMRLAIIETMCLPEGDNRMWFVVDELDAVGRIENMKDAQARLRKFGGRVVIGFQSIAQVASTYGIDDCHTITENCTNSLILRCSASASGGTSEIASMMIGDREVVNVNANTDSQGRQGTSQNSTINRLVLPSEIEQLPDLQGFLKVADSPYWFPTVLSPYNLEKQAERFEPASF